MVSFNHGRGYYERKVGKSLFWFPSKILADAKKSLKSGWPASDLLPADPTLVPLPPFPLSGLLVPCIAGVTDYVPLPALLQSHRRGCLLCAHRALKPPPGFCCIGLPGQPQLLNSSFDFSKLLIMLSLHCTHLLLHNIHLWAQSCSLTIQGLFYTLFHARHVQGWAFCIAIYRESNILHRLETSENIAILEDIAIFLRYLLMHDFGQFWLS